MSSSSESPLPREVKNEGILFFCEPIEVIVDDFIAASIPAELPEWDANTWYPAGALVKVGSRSFISALTEAFTYLTDCPRLYNLNKNPTDDPPPFVPLDDEPPFPAAGSSEDGPNVCGYEQAGMAWWAEIDPEIAYLDALLNFNTFSGVDVFDNISFTLAPKAAYDAIGIFGLHADTATLYMADARPHDLYLFDRDNPPDPLPYGPTITHSNHVVWMLEEPTTEAFTIHLTALNGRCAAGTLVVARTNVFGVTNYMTTIGIVDYSRKDRDLFGRVQLVPRWYQQKVKFLMEVSAADRGVVTQVLTRLRNTPCLVVGHDDPKRYELQIFGLLKDVGLPLNNAASSVIDVEIESVGVPRLISGIPMEPIPPPPPLPDEEVTGPYLAIGHDKSPFITIVDTGTWQEVTVNFTIPGPARATLFSKATDQYLFIGHDCPPFFTVVTVADWTAVNFGSSEALGLPGVVDGLALSPGDTAIALAHDCPPYLTILSTADWSNISQDLAELPRQLSKVTYSEDGQWLLLHDSCQRRHELATSDLTVVDTLLNRGRAGIYATDNLHWILGYGEYSGVGTNRVDLVNRALREQVSTLALPGEPYIVKYSPDRAFVAVGHRCPPYLTIIDVATWEAVETFFYLEYSVCSLEFNQDGSFLAVVYRHHPYCTLIRTINWTEFHLSFLAEDQES